MFLTWLPLFGCCCVAPDCYRNLCFRIAMQQVNRKSVVSRERAFLHFTPDRYDDRVLRTVVLFPLTIYYSPFTIHYSQTLC
jgi:hypothetical protein